MKKLLNFLFKPAIDRDIALAKLNQAIEIQEQADLGKDTNERLIAYYTVRALVNYGESIGLKPTYTIYKKSKDEN